MYIQRWQGRIHKQPRSRNPLFLPPPKIFPKRGFAQQVQLPITPALEEWLL